MLDRPSVGVPMLFTASFDAASLSSVRRQIRHQLGRVRLDPGRVDDFLLAVAEILANAVEHGGGSGTVGQRQGDGHLSCCDKVIHHAVPSGTRITLMITMLPARGV